MDDTQRNIAATLGIGLMLGAIAWVSTFSATASHSPLLRIAPPAAMFVVGALIVVWAWRGHDPRRALLDKAIADGRTILGIEDHDVLVVNWHQWDHDTLWMLRQHFGVDAGFALGDAVRAVLRPGEQNPRAWLTAEIEYLEGLRKRR